MNVRFVRSLVAAAAFVAAAAAQGARAQDREAAVPLLDVPYIAQSEALCGGAAAAMVMRYWGATGIYAESFADLVNRDAGGIRGDDLLRALDARGWEARSFRGDALAVQSHLAKRRPVVALVEDRPGRFHYVVIVAWPSGRVVLHDPARAPFRVLNETDFVRAWEAAGFWTMLMLPGSPDATEPARLRLSQPSQATSSGEAPRQSAHETSARRRAIARVPDGPIAGVPDNAACGLVVDEGVRLAGGGDRDAARRLFELAAAACPLAPAPRREIAGLHALAGEWREAAVHARHATELDPSDHHAWRILATAAFLNDDRGGALDAWNRVGAPVVDIVNITGLERTRHQVAAAAIAIEPQTMLTNAALERARRRLAALPAAQTARLSYRPGENGQSQVDAVVIERPLLPVSTPSLVASGVRLVADRELSIVVASPTGGGEVWSASWRWWEHRPRIAAGFAAPAPFGGTWRVDVFDERQSYGSRQHAIRERRRGAAVSIGDWLGGSTRWDVSLGADRWRAGGRGASIGGGIERHLARDTVVLSTRAAAWFGSIDTWTASARADWRSSSKREGHVLSARAGVSLAGARAPFALWHGAGTGQRADVLLRAHPVIDSGHIDGAVIGRRLVHAGVEWQRWLQPVKRVLRIAPAIFVDAGRSSRGGPFSDSRAHVDVGAGMRFVLPGAGLVGVDVGRGLRDGKMAVSVGWRR